MNTLLAWLMLLASGQAPAEKQSNLSEFQKEAIDVYEKSKTQGHEEDFNKFFTDYKDSLDSPYTNKGEGNDLDTKGN